MSGPVGDADRRLWLGSCAVGGWPEREGAFQLFYFSGQKRVR